MYVLLLQEVMLLFSPSLASLIKLSGCGFHFCVPRATLSLLNKC
jgi:hypothetical protein